MIPENSATSPCQYVWAPDGSLILRDRDADNDATHTAEERLYALTDIHGSVMALTDASGAVVERYTYNMDGQPEARQPDWSGWNNLAPGTPYGNYYSQYDWSYLYGGQRWVQTISATYVSGGWEAPAGLYLNGGGAFDPQNGRSLKPNPMAAAEGRNAYNSGMWGGWADTAAVIRMGAWLGGPVVGIAVNWAGSSYERSLDGKDNVFFGGFGDATRISAVYNGYEHGSWSEAGLGLLQVGLTALSFGKPLGMLQGCLPVGGPTMGQLGGALAQDMGLVAAGRWAVARNAESLAIVRDWMRPPFALQTVSGAAVAGAIGGDSAAAAFGWGLPTWGEDLGVFGNAVFSALRNPWHSDMLESGAVRRVSDYRAGVLERPGLHHIASDKSLTYTPDFQRLFRNAGMTLEHHLNKLLVPGHMGPHGGAYNWIVLNELTDALAGLEAGSVQYRWALRSALKGLAAEIGQRGSDLNLMVRFPG